MKINRFVEGSSTIEYYKRMNWDEKLKDYAMKCYSADMIADELHCNIEAIVGYCKTVFKMSFGEFKKSIYDGRDLECPSCKKFRPKEYFHGGNGNKVPSVGGNCKICRHRLKGKKASFKHNCYQNDEEKYDGSWLGDNHVYL